MRLYYIIWRKFPNFDISGEISLYFTLNYAFHAYNFFAKIITLSLSLSLSLSRKIVVYLWWKLAKSFQNTAWKCNFHVVWLTWKSKSYIRLRFSTNPTQFEQLGQYNTFRSELLCRSFVLRRSLPRNVLQNMAELSKQSIDPKQMVVVLNSPSNVEDELTIHFQKERNGGGNVDDVVVDGSVSFVTFDMPEGLSSFIYVPSNNVCIV